MLELLNKITVLGFESFNVHLHFFDVGILCALKHGIEFAALLFVH